ncbi:amino acid/polyamine/organocation transporter, APC superfamily (TC 2.A.3) [Desulfotomaculum arcticum]|uniref:Amino acid/polyamine/organocation transporter, APC superfamily (TC 2.A.3) n=1 Tax=Desulfotruncus arcticus DSM 17038 TaxID=1121424 RepID=A0A1I2WXE8_9FIRM|nr:amino acid permease [Desulfotruncus arcticus]SFH06014.1 amino acid/polyamine/organocation transporter, APC superfamily (TC 2.A.3) [Desulfotomaculum arcticum] [Desulfotruncus arcticus DSM 17038]
MSGNNNDNFVRVLSRKDVLALAFGAMIGWGWVVMAGSWVSTAGSMGAMLAFVLGGLLVVLVGLTYSELASAMPLTGGEHVYSYRALGVTASFICTWAIILGYVSVVAFEAVALPTVTEYLFPGYKFGYLWTIAEWDVYASWVLIGVLGSIFITIINYVGIKVAAFLQLVFTIAIALVGLVLIGGAAVNGSTAHMEPLFVNGMKGIFAVAIMTPFMFVGFDVIPQAAEEINIPYKSIGKILIASVFLAALWYILVIFGVSRALTAEQMNNASLVTADAMTALFGGAWAGKLLIIGGICGILTSWNGFYIGGSRAIYAMAQAKMLPSFLGKLHPKYKTPYNAIILIGVLSTLAPLFGRKMLVWLVDAGGLGIVAAYFMVALSFVVLRKKEPQMARPFKVQAGNLVGYLAVILSALFILLYLPGSPAALVWPYEWLIFLGWSVIGIVFFVWARSSYGKDEADRAMHEHVFVKLNNDKNISG